MQLYMTTFFVMTRMDLPTPQVMSFNNDRKFQIPHINQNINKSSLMIVFTKQMINFQSNVPDKFWFWSCYPVAYSCFAKNFLLHGRFIIIALSSWTKLNLLILRYFQQTIYIRFVQTCYVTCNHELFNLEKLYSSYLCRYLEYSVFWYDLCLHRSLDSPWGRTIGCGTTYTIKWNSGPRPVTSSVQFVHRHFSTWGFLVRARHGIAAKRTVWGRLDVFTWSHPKFPWVHLTVFIPWARRSIIAEWKPKNMNIGIKIWKDNKDVLITILFDRPWKYNRPTREDCLVLLYELVHLF